MNTQSPYHLPVLKKETVDALNIESGHWYIDGNLGGGGHTKEILLRGGKVIGIDLDKESIDFVSRELRDEIEEKRLILFQSNFSRLREIWEKSKLDKVSGVLFDLGVSSHQLESPFRGFSFNLDALLDMRMDQSGGASAQDLINGLGEGELAKLFTKLGEERFSRMIARRIVEERRRGIITTTNQLAGIIVSVRRTSKFDRTHPATRVFQALRIAVNDELNSLKEALPQAFDILEVGGRMAVISFHSLEDRIVKNYFKDLEHREGARNIFKKPVSPTDEEIEYNPRSRSGKLRVIEKLANQVGPEYKNPNDKGGSGDN